MYHQFRNVENGMPGPRGPSTLGQRMDTGLGSLSSFFKKASKLSLSHQLVKKVAPKVSKKLEKITPIGLTSKKKSSPKTPPKNAVAAVDIPANATQAPMVLTPQDMAQMPQASFAPSGGGGGPVTFAPDSSGGASEPAASTGPDYATWALYGVGALALYWLLFKKRRG